MSRVSFLYIVNGPVCWQGLPRGRNKIIQARKYLTKKEARLTARVKDTLTLEVRVSFTYLQ